jgi:predicted dehydrogenase
MTFRIAVIGAGVHGGRYLRHALNDVPGMQPVALNRRDPVAGQALAAEVGCAFVPDGLELIADPEVDGVIVCTPPSTHFPYAAAARQAGKPLLLEKPCTGTLAEAEELWRLDTSCAGPPLMVAQTLRWNPVIQKVKELWPRLGRVHLVRLAQRLEPTELSWQWNAAETVGGSILLEGVHLADLVRHLTGAEFVAVDSRHRFLRNDQAEDLFLARARLSDGCWASLEVSKFTESRAAWLEAVGEKGQLQADYLHGGITLRCGAHEERFDVSARVPTLPPVLRAWQASVEKGQAPPVGIADGLATMRVVDACYRSDREGGDVEI